MNPRLITLTTDFGIRDSYVSCMIGQIRRINPSADIIHTSNLVGRQNILEGAFTLRNTLPFYPPATIHLVVVDPDVGGDRDAIAVFHHGQFFVAPDNGILTLALDTTEPEQLVSIQNPAYMSREISPVFHGRDVFSPAAAWLSQGVPMSLLGPQRTTMTDLRWSLPVYDKNRIIGQIIHIDHFGNAISNISQQFLNGWAGELSVQVSLSGWDPLPVSRTYSDVEPGDAVALIGSGGYLEVAVFHANASGLFDIRPGSQIVVEKVPE